VTAALALGVLDLFLVWLFLATLAAALQRRQWR
jgi:hypothetical protein